MDVGHKRRRPHASYMGCDTPVGFLALRLSCWPTQVSTGNGAGVDSADAWTILAAAALAVLERLETDHRIHHSVAVLVASRNGSVCIDVCFVSGAATFPVPPTTKELRDGLITSGPFFGRVADYALFRGVDNEREGGAGILRDRRSRESLLGHMPQLEKHVGRNARACATGREASQVIMAAASKIQLVERVKMQLCSIVWERMLSIDFVAGEVVLEGSAAVVLSKADLYRQSAPLTSAAATMPRLEKADRLARLFQTGAKRATVESTQTLEQQVERAIGAELERWPSEMRVAATAPKLGFLYATYNSGVGRNSFYAFCLHNGCPLDLLAEWLCARGCLSRDALGELRSFAGRLLRGGMRSGAPSNNEFTVEVNNPRQVVRMNACCTQSQYDRACAAIARVRATARGGGDSKPSCRPQVNDPSCGNYYKRMFPWRAVASLLHRETSAVQLREISPDKRMWRSRPCLDPARPKHCAGNFVGMHVGPAYDHGTQQACCGSGATLRTELVLEIDEVPEEVPEPRRWEWLRGATHVALAVVRQWFDVRHVLMFGSGNRGPHMWLLDEAVLQQTTELRTAWMSRLEQPWNEPGWSALRKEWLLPFAKEFYVPRRSDSEDGRGYSEASFESMLPQRLASLCFPKFDRAVALQPSHLHRLPFSIHEKSMRIALPFAHPDDMPRDTSDMPRVGEADCSAFRRALSTLQAVVDRLDARDSSDPLATVPAVRSAPWFAKFDSKRQPPTGPLSPLAAVGDMQIHLESTACWLEALQTGGSVTVGSAQFSAADLEKKGSDLQERVQREVAKLRFLLNTLRQPQHSDDAEVEYLSLEARPYMNGGAAGRVLTYYPQLDRSQFVQCLSKASREVITNRSYAEVDFGTAHVAAAWGALCAYFGLERASSLCPCLEMAARDKKAARERVARENRGKPLGWAKCSILAALNQELGDGIVRSRFLEGLVSERPHAIEALRNHPCIAGPPLQSIRAESHQSAKPHVREMSLMLQTLETAMLAEAVRSFNLANIETVALIADGLLVRPRLEMDTEAANLAVSNACVRARHDISEALSVDVSLDVERCIA